MASKDELIQILYSAIDEINQDLPQSDRLEKSPATTILGDNSKLDSLSFINFILAVEAKTKEKFAKNLQLLNQSSMSSEQGSFATVESLAEYIAKLT